jgi:hypothetical protein
MEKIQQRRATFGFLATIFPWGRFARHRLHRLATLVYPRSRRSRGADARIIS